MQGTRPAALIQPHMKCGSVTSRLLTNRIIDIEQRSTILNMLSNFGGTNTYTIINIHNHNVFFLYYPEAHAQVARRQQNLMHSLNTLQDTSLHRYQSSDCQRSLCLMMARSLRYRCLCPPERPGPVPLGCSLQALCSPAQQPTCVVLTVP